MYSSSYSACKCIYVYDDCARFKYILLAYFITRCILEHHCAWLHLCTIVSVFSLCITMSLLQLGTIAAFMTKDSGIYTIVYTCRDIVPSKL